MPQRPGYRDFHKRAETPFGHVLHWRNYLGKVGVSAIAPKQACWSLDGQTITYLGVSLRMVELWAKLDGEVWSNAEASYLGLLRPPRSRRSSSARTSRLSST